MLDGRSLLRLAVVERVSAESRADNRADRVEHSPGRVTDNVTSIMVSAEGKNVCNRVNQPTTPWCGSLETLLGARSFEFWTRLAHQRKNFDF